MSLDILYFAWLRERIGAPREVSARAEALRPLAGVAPAGWPCAPSGRPGCCRPKRWA